MKRIYLYMLAAAMMLAGCKESDNSDDNVTAGLELTFDIDWSDLPQRPTGLTMCFYPTGQNASTTEVSTMHFDEVDRVTVTLPGDDYALICFNQSEGEFADYHFDLSSYETASVTGVENSSLKPGSLAVASLNSVNQSSTRALNLMGVLKPTNVVKSMTLRIHVEGLRERVEVHGSLSNMCPGVTMCDRKPLPSAIEQPLPPSDWKIAVPDDAELPTELIAEFGAFGPFMDDETRVAATRAVADDGLRNILHITAKSVETGQIVYEDDIDVTETIVEQYLASIYNGHDYVDLGLPSGLLWATCNVGAESGEESGGYYAWGETCAAGEEDESNAMNYAYADSYVKNYYSWETYKYCNGTASSMTKYNDNEANGTVDDLTVLTMPDDAAASNWGGVWRMPTDAEWTELRENCTWEWISSGYATGYTVTGPNGQSIFLPVCGYRQNGRLVSSNDYGYYWSSSLNTAGTANAFYVYFDQTSVSRGSGLRYFGRSVRAVCEP
ncbi:MAG: DUF5119 domain-containing protein [Bacteroidales bacterium]|jgi:hypothetical protein|nr:DUF5119 domain-containing protein [Bacteroidales bacterium]